MLHSLHFLQPAWFLLLIPLGALLGWLYRRADPGERALRRICDPRLLRYLLVGGGGRSTLPVWLLALGWLVAVLALANPAWERLPQPVFETEAARVIVLDLSRSMNTADLKPSRLARARYKVSDILRQTREGDTGLVVFAGDAFVVSPLTRDADTIESQLAALDPDIMPVQGSRVDLGIRKAGELLAQAGRPHGEILLIADGYDRRRAIKAAEELRGDGYRVSVLAVGTKAGAPLPGPQGGFVRDAGGDIVVPKLDTGAMRELAAAGGGRFATLTSDNADLRRLLAPMEPRLDSQARKSGLEAERWRERGPWLLLLLLPLAALAFRRGWLLGVLLLAGTLSAPHPAMALGWDDLWSRRDQQAARALDGGDLGQASTLADDPALRGTAEYRKGDFEKALESFRNADGPDAEYNRGNALARLGRYQDAIAAYDRALAAQPGMEDAAYNKARVEVLLRQQQASSQHKEGTDDHGKQGESGADRQGKGQQQGEDQAGQAGQQTADRSGKEDTGGSAAESPSAQGQDKGPQDADGRQTQEPSDGRQGVQGAEGAGDSVMPPRDDQAAANPPQGDHDDADSGGQGQEAQRSVTDAGRGGEDAGGQATAAPAPAMAEPLSSEEQQAAEQWLRRIPDDPGGLLRRKFLYQYRQRAGQGDSDAKPW
jgi:Ca-activated chloride channel family protein